MHYVPMKHGLTKCRQRNVSDLSSAAELLGGVLVLGCRLCIELKKPGDNPTHPFHVNNESSSTAKYQRLQGMIVAERWLIEFLLGPSGKKRPDDVCVDCFHYNWRFPVGDIANELCNRKRTINKLVLHPTWTFVKTEPRHWTLTRIERCIEGLNTFADGIAKELPDVTKVLKEHVGTASTILGLGVEGIKA
jgi:hypothetical protein